MTDQPKQRSQLQQAKKIIAGSLAAAATVPTVALLAQGLFYDSVSLGEWLPRTEHHREPKHGMGDVPQQLVLTSPSSSGAPIRIGWTANVPTPIADVFLVTRAEKTVEYDHTVALQAAALVVEEAVANQYRRVVINYDSPGTLPKVEWRSLDEKANG